MKIEPNMELLIGGRRFRVRAGIAYIGVGLCSPWKSAKEVDRISEILGDMDWGAGYSKDFKTIEALEKWLEDKEVTDITDKALQDYLNAKDIKED